LKSIIFLLIIKLIEWVHVLQKAYPKYPIIEVCRYRYIYKGVHLLNCMALLDKERSFRTTDEIEEKLKQLFMKDNKTYENFSHVIRCAIIKLHKQEVLNGNKSTSGT